ncbi:hypothetical protein [Aurantimonas coralicida]|uniref:hypothetical protein n=1 Tax=Aurantimonas coralicida TaxID=182270 RepID=UPI001E64CDB4|nr:hypothetical protein [Aurantimonas coralicida]MCD1645188.1 hypothetical protein [Aurantimonas coralicida]
MGSSLSTTKSISPALSRDLTPCDPKEALRLLGPLFRNLASDRKFENTERGASEKQEAMAVYVRPLTKEPAWAIELAVTRFLDGLVDRHKSRVGWVPKSDEFAQEVRRLTDWTKEQEHRKQRLAKKPEAEVQNEKMGPEARAVVDAFLRKSRELQQEEASR